MNILSKYPWLVWGVGLIIGIYAHKHRKQIMEISREATHKGKGFAKRQTENLSELIVFKHH